MYEWNEAVQKIIDWIEDNICDDPSLIKMSEHIGYSPWYCSVKFHEITGMTIKSYISGRRLALAALAIRDTKERLIDIAVKFGYSSQEALTRAFSIAFGCTPAAYRKAPIPVPMSIKQVVFLPEHYHALKVKGESSMSNNLIEANVRIEFIPSPINISEYGTTRQRTTENSGKTTTVTLSAVSSTV